MSEVIGPQEKMLSPSQVGPLKFAELHNLDIPAIVLKLNTKPVIRVEAGRFVTYLEGQRYVLGKTDAGI
jgi:hypothetical protein